MVDIYSQDVRAREPVDHYVATAQNVNSTYGAPWYEYVEVGSAYLQDIHHPPLTPAQAFDINTILTNEYSSSYYYSLYDCQGYYPNTWDATPCHYLPPYTTADVDPVPTQEQYSRSHTVMEEVKGRKQHLRLQHTDILEAWLHAHLDHPYPSEEEKGTFRGLNEANTYAGILTMYVAMYC